jgi:hypothetical protein
MVRRPAGGLGINPAKPKLGQIEPPDKDINHANRIILANPIFQAFRKQCALPAIHPLNKALHPIPPQIAQESYRKNHINPRVFTQPGPITAGYFEAKLAEFILPYDILREAAEPDALLLHFLTSTYAAAAEAGHWDRGALECQTGVPAQVRPL